VPPIMIHDQRSLIWHFQLCLHTYPLQFHISSLVFMIFSRRKEIEVERNFWCIDIFVLLG
jgi:hypothetical protein